MARSRNIKPGFFKNELLAEVHPLGRLLFEGLWCLADREGRLENRPKRIKAEVLPYDNCDIDELLTQLEEREFIIRYEAEGQSYIQILTFKKHQNPHVREAASTIPAYIRLVSNEHDKSTGLEQDKHRTSHADSLLLIPDSLNPHTDSLKLIPENKPSAPGNIYKLFEKEFGRLLSPMEIDEINDLENTYGYDFVKEALKRSIIQGKRNLKYTLRILENWRNANLKSIQEVLDYEQVVEDQKSKRKGNNNQSIPVMQPDPAKVIENDNRLREEKITAAVTYIKFQLGESPPSDKAREIALGYGEDIVNEILNRLYGKEDKT